MIRKALAVFVSVVIGLMAVASALPEPTCGHEAGESVCSDVCDCECGHDDAPLPICCLEIEGLPEMIQPHVDPTPKQGAVRLEPGIHFAARRALNSAVANVRSSRRLSGPPLYRLHRTILC